MAPLSSPPICMTFVLRALNSERLVNGLVTLESTSLLMLENFPLTFFPGSTLFPDVVAPIFAFAYSRHCVVNLSDKCCDRSGRPLCASSRIPLNLDLMSSNVNGHNVGSSDSTT